MPGLAYLAALPWPPQQAARGWAAWFAATRSFILVSWLLLSAGIILGGWWAYMELGWGGYWGWDPVENASLLPWLFATAAPAYPTAIERATGKLSRMAALFIEPYAFERLVFCHLKARSGIIQSVHAFGDGGVGLPLAVFWSASLQFACWPPFARPKQAPPWIPSTAARARLCCGLDICSSRPDYSHGHNVAGIETQSGVLPHRGLRPVSTIVSACRFWRFCSLFWHFALAFMGQGHCRHPLQISADRCPAFPCWPAGP